VQYLLSPSNREILAQMAWSNVLLAFDFDGTLAPIVEQPEAAALPQSTRLVLERLALRYPCAIISGRSREDVLRRVHGIQIWSVIGNHGLEPSDGAHCHPHEVEKWRRTLERRLVRLEGVFIEDKVFSLAIHYRRSRKKRHAFMTIREAVRSLKNVRVIRGKDVVNLVAPDAPHKGMALEDLRARFGCDTALYVGDDETDEDVFELDQPGRLLCVRVGRRERSAASYYLRSQSEVTVLLEILLSLRPSPQSFRERGM
jgi:trehalose 6-phosphate phosphatase